MNLDPIRCGNSVTTYLVRFLPGVNASMILQMCRMKKGLLADLTLEGL